jgi:site-specific DNA-cytosine methylase
LSVVNDQAWRESFGQEGYDHGLANPESPSPTIKAGGNFDASGKQGGGCPPAIPYRWSEAMLAKHPPASPASPILAKFYKGGAEGLLQITDNKKHQPHQPHQPANTLNSGGGGHGPTYANQHLAVPEVIAAPCPTISSGGTSTGGAEPIPHMKRELFVRRLTPDECMRLMSAPDDFKWPDKISKTAKYKIAGNGWASRMGAVFAEAFRRADPESQTVIDLFCGGGLGACGWHGRYWSYDSPTPNTRTL